MIDSELYRKQLADYLAMYGMAYDEQILSALLHHLDLVVEKNKSLNLTRIVDADDAVIRHVVDSLLLIPSITNLGLPEDSRYLDIGTGAGFPGIPLGIVTSYRGLLIDSVGKKVNAVDEFLHALGIDDRVHALSIRAEELAKQQAGSFDLLTARAVADLGVLVEYAAPLLKRNGFLVVSKARIADEEINRGDKTAKIVGLTNVSRETYELPKDAGHREIITYKKTGKSKVKLPRQVGAAKHKPLA